MNGRLRFDCRFSTRDGSEHVGYRAVTVCVATFHEVAGNKPWFCCACGRRLPRRHLADLNSTHRLHLLGCARDA
jgi:hypothetical protein